MVHASRGASVSRKYGWNPIATGIGSALRLWSSTVMSSTPSRRRCVISMVCAKGNCAIQSGCRKNSSRLVTHADPSSAFASTTSHTAALRNPWIGCAPRTLPSSMFSA